MEDINSLKRKLKVTKIVSLVVNLLIFSQCVAILSLTIYLDDETHKPRMDFGYVDVRKQLFFFYFISLIKMKLVMANQGIGLIPHRNRGKEPRPLDSCVQ